MNIILSFLSGDQIAIPVPKYDFNIPVHLFLSNKLIRENKEYEYYKYSQFMFYVTQMEDMEQQILENSNVKFDDIYDSYNENNENDENDENIDIIVNVYIQSHMDCPEFYQKYIRMMHEDEFHRPFDDSDFTPLMGIEYNEYHKKYYWINYEKGEEYNMVRFYNYDPNYAPNYLLMYSSNTLYIANNDQRKESHNTFCDDTDWVRTDIQNAVYTETAKRRFAIILRFILDDYSENEKVIESANQFLSIIPL